jgi:hypothetical protein
MPRFEHIAFVRGKTELPAKIRVFLIAVWDVGLEGKESCGWRI